jgi:hypothetical protein
VKGICGAIVFSLFLLAGCGAKKHVVIYPEDGRPIECWIHDCLDSEGGVNLYSDPDCSQLVGYVKGTFRVEYTTTGPLEQPDSTPEITIRNL